MIRDHVHLTAEGYRKSADQFLTTLVPIIERQNGIFEQRWNAQTDKNWPTLELRELTNIGLKLGVSPACMTRYGILSSRAAARQQE
jgi:hypothetical protein